LIALVDARTVNSKIAKTLLERMWNGDGSPKAIVEREGLAQTSDPGAVEKFVDDVLAANPNVVAEYRAGKTNVTGFLVGQVMKASRGKADPALVNDVLKRRLST
jgi:aspartyl-tRNA(Asn)/glutamyl-tRNA(Gln) amidotransferase subunit B